MLGDSSGLGRAQKQAALYRIQGGLCAVCRRPGRAPAEPGRHGKLRTDHDHRTGLLRGLLCQSCNQREGIARSRLLGREYADITAYLAAPPAGPLRWLWELPDWWGQEDTAAVRARECTIVEYVAELDAAGTIEKRAAAEERAALAAMRATAWPPLDA